MTLLVRQALTALALRLAAAVTTYANTLLLARWMAGSDYGYFASTISSVTLIATLAGLGIPLSLLRYLGEFKAKGQTSQARHLIRHSAIKALVVSAVIALAGVAFGVTVLWIPGVASANSLEGLGFLGFGLIWLPAFVAADVHGAILRSFGKIFAALAPRDVLWRLTLLPLGFLSANLIAADYQFLAILFGGTISLFVLIFFQGLYCWRLAPRPEDDGGTDPDLSLTSKINRTTRNIWLTTVSTVAFNNLDVVFVLLFFNPEITGLYFAASRTAGLSSFALNSVNTIVGPRISASYFNFEHEKLLADLRFGAVMSFLPAVAIFTIIILFGRHILGLFGEDFISMFPILLVLSAGQLVNGITGSCGLLLNMTGRDAIYARIALVALAAAAIGMFIFGRLFGIFGIAIAVSVASGSYQLTIWMTALKTTGFDASILSWLRGLPIQKGDSTS